MNIVNTTNSPRLPDYAIRRAASWVCKQLSMSPKEIRTLRIRNRSDGNHSGRCWIRTGDIVCSVGRPTVSNLETSSALRMRFDILMPVLAHEIAHRYLYLVGAGKTRTGRAGGSERDTRWHERELFQYYVNDRDFLLGKWLEPRDAELADMIDDPALAAQVQTARRNTARAQRRQRRAQRDAALLATWERKLKLAKTKVAKYKAKVRRATTDGLL